MMPSSKFRQCSLSRSIKIAGSAFFCLLATGLSAQLADGVSARAMQVSSPTVCGVKIGDAIALEDLGFDNNSLIIDGINNKKIPFEYKCRIIVKNLSLTPVKMDGLAWRQDGNSKELAQGAFAHPISLEPGQADTLLMPVAFDAGPMLETGDTRYTIREIMFQFREKGVKTGKLNLFVAPLPAGKAKPQGWSAVNESLGK